MDFLAIDSMSFLEGSVIEAKSFMSFEIKTLLLLFKAKLLRSDFNLKPSSLIPNWDSLINLFAS